MREGIVFIRVLACILIILSLIVYSEIWSNYILFYSGMFLSIILLILSCLIPIFNTLKPSCRKKLIQRKFLISFLGFTFVFCVLQLITIWLRLDEIVSSINLLIYSIMGTPFWVGVSKYDRRIRN